MKTLRMIGAALIAIVLSAGFCACSDDDDDNTIGNGNNGGTIKTENSVTLQTAGTLSLVLGDKVQYITSLKIKGPLNGDDIICLRQMLRCTDEDADKRGMLTVLDLSDANIVSGGDKYYNGSYSTSSGKIGNYMFCYCESLRQIALPNSVSLISGYAFQYCKNLTQIIIGERTTSISDHAFYECTGLTSITIPNSVTSLGVNAFTGCDNLAYVTIGEGLTSNDAFSFHTSIKEFEVVEGNEYLCAQDGVLYSKDMTTLIQFPAASSKTSYTIPNSVATIDKYSFYSCSGLTEVTIGNSVTEIGKEAFYRCAGLTEITIPNSVTSIGSSAFYECSGLIEVTIGNSVKSINNYAFQYCSKLTSITSLNPEPPGCSSNAFSGVDTSICVLYVPKGAKEAYSAANTWKSFKNIVEI